MKNTLFIFLFVLCACKGQKETQSQTLIPELSQETKTGLRKYFKESSYKIFLSPKETYLLLISEATGDVSQPRIKQVFVVLRQSDQNVQYSDQIELGTITWFSDNELEIFQEPGIFPKDRTKDDFTYILNLETQERIKKTQYEN